MAGFGDRDLLGHASNAQGVPRLRRILDLVNVAILQVSQLESVRDVPSGHHEQPPPPIGLVIIRAIGGLIDGGAPARGAGTDNAVLP